MKDKPTVVIFFNDWEVFPEGVNAGGGETSTLALAREIVGLGYRVIACANLPKGECNAHGIQFWNFGSSYALHEIEKRLRDIGDYYAVCATLVHPVLLLKSHPNCRAAIVINHAPSAYASGLEPVTVLEVVDRMLCVSHAQRLMIAGQKPPSEKMVVVRNGFSPDIFTYAGPEDRDWNQMIFVGRLEVPKGIHVLLQVFADLKRDFPELKLSVFGAEAHWAEFNAQKEQMMRDMPGLVFHGKVPQHELAMHMRKAGLLVFPSISFETAGLAIVDAQASGCPVVGFGVGGVPEYLQDGVLGEVVYERTPQALREAISRLLSDRARLEQFSRNGLAYGRNRTWRVVAQDVLRELHANSSRSRISIRLLRKRSSRRTSVQ
jgi:glycosyltransferase involved in cell wall biosynthesis